MNGASPMKRLRVVSLAAVAAVGFAVAALVAQSEAPSGAKMADAARTFLAALPPDQKAAAAYPFGDKQRTVWFFTPQQEKKVPTRKGLRLDQMTPEARTAAMNLLKAGLSPKGYEQATTIMGLEGVLKELEGANGANVRNPQWYFVSVFGEPSNTGTWGWRFEGHHLSVNVTLDKGEVAEATPIVFGTNPAVVKDGPKAGLKTLPEVEDLARELIKGLTPEQDEAAKQAKHFPEIREGFADAGAGEPVGLPAAKLTAPQKATLTKLLEAYAGRMPPDLAAAEMKRAEAAGPDKVYFGYSGSIEAGKPYTYRIQGPTFVVEFLNVQADSAKNPANHIHSTWRRLPADFAVKP